MIDLSSNRAAECGAVILHSMTCQPWPVAVMGLATGKMSLLSRAGGAALRTGSSAFDLAEMAASRFVICYLRAGAPSESVALPAARRFTSSWSLAGGAAGERVGADIQEGGEGVAHAARALPPNPLRREENFHIA